MRTALWIAVALAGCGGTRSKADEAYGNGNYLAAQELYDKVARDNPKDHDAVARRDLARNAYLRVVLVQVQTAQAAHADAAAADKLLELVERRDGWQLAVDPRLSPAIASAVEATGHWLAAAIAARTPLAAEDVLAHYDHLLAHFDFRAAKTELVAAVKSAGQTKCHELDTTTAYASWIAAKYCAHFDIVRSVPVLTNGLASLAIEGGIAGEDADQNRALRAALAGAFEHSPWFEPRAPATGHATIDGRIAAAFEAYPVTRTKTWTEQVPYTAYEQQQESYQEPYTDTESYTESVPSTEYPSCSSPPCPPVTVYHDETRTRTVTKYRTAYRTVTKPVTRYRDEQREFSYSAINRIGNYTSRMRVMNDRDLAQPAVIDSAFRQTGDDHDVINAAAGVSPERANLLSLAAFAAREQDRLVQRFADALDQRYAARFCMLATYTVESAAACAYRDATHVPPAARDALARMLGGDEPFVARLLAR